MCYEERLLSFWTAKKAQKPEKDQPVTGRDRPHVQPIRTARAAEPKPHKETEREPEEIV